MEVLINSWVIAEEIKIYSAYAHLCHIIQAKELLQHNSYTKNHELSQMLDLRTYLFEGEGEVLEVYW